jgi:hypothetical protein
MTSAKSVLRDAAEAEDAEAPDADGEETDSSETEMEDTAEPERSLDDIIDAYTA